MTFKEGAVAMVTGGGSGIGRKISLEFAKNSIKVAVCDVNAQNAEAAAREIRDLGGEAVAVAGDVSVPEDCGRMVQAAMDSWNRLDILINNAGLIRDALIVDMSEKKWDLVQNVVNKGAFLCTQAAARVMIPRNYGRIVNISSGAYLGNMGQANYSSAKAGLVALTKVAALEFAKNNITVNCLAPGLIRTPLTSGLPEAVWKRLEKSIPAGFVGEPEDVAYIILALVAEEARYVTGQVIHIDGGVTTGLRM